MKYIIKKFQSEEGFDLVQVLVTVAILAVIATIAVLALIGQLSKGDEAAAKSNVNQAITAAQIALTEGPVTGPPAQTAAEHAEADAGAVSGVSATLTGSSLAISSTDATVDVDATVNTETGAVTRSGDDW